MKPDAMIASLKKTFVPALRERGFKGSFPHFRRPGVNCIDLLTVQFDKRGGGFVVEISRCSPEGITTHWGKHVPPDKVTAWDMFPKDRLRLGVRKPGEDHWFRFDDGTPADKVAERATCYLSKADEWWCNSV